MILEFDEKHLQIEFDKLDEFFRYPNAALCNQKLNELMHKRGHKGAVIKVYLENFKGVNETFGYQFGEMLLQTIARFLCSVERGVDVYRSAGVEFTMILDNRKPGAIIDIIEKIEERFEKVWHIGTMDCMCSSNIAAAYFPGHAMDAEELMEQLNYTLSVSAQQGPNMHCFFDDALHKKFHRRKSVARLIPYAVEQDQIELRYRPLYSTEAKRFTRAESRMRLMSPEFGAIHAEEFVSIAEETGQIYLVSKYALDKVCEFASMLMKQGVEFEKLYIPISPVQFLQERFIEDIKQTLSTRGVPPQRIAFEVEANIAMSNFASSHSRMGDIADLGIEFILTDFGSGSSGVANVIGMPVSAVKLERLMTWQIDNDPKGAALVEGLVILAKKLGLKVVAEGVETETQVKELNKYGCDYQQGFYYSASLNADELAEALQRS